MSDSPLRTNADFRRLWSASTLSTAGTEVTALAVPLTAVVFLHASTFAVGALTAAASLPMLVVGLPAGAWVDRRRRRPILIAMDLVRAVALVTIPVAAAFHVVTMVQLYAVALVVGAGSVVYDIAYQSFVPSIIARDQLAAGNGQMQASQSAAMAIGPGIAGAAVQALTAPFAIALDAASYLWSAGWLARIRASEPRRGPFEPQRPPLRRDIADGVRFIAGDRLLRAIAIYTMCSTFCLSIDYAIDVLFLVRTVGLSPFGIGVLTGVASVGAVLGGLAARRLIMRAGPLRLMLVASPAGNACMVLVPLAAHGWRSALYAIGVGGASFGIVLFNVACLTFRQSTFPDRMLGRIGATMRFSSMLLFPVGALAGGAVATAIGLRATLGCAAVAGVAASLLLLPVRRATMSTVDQDRDSTDGRTGDSAGSRAADAVVGQV